MTAVLIFFAIHWYASIFIQTFFHHRYAAHAMFTMNPFWEKFFYVFTFFAQGSSYLSPRAYGIMHRMHHAYADTEKDPHSPIYDHTIWNMMMNTRVRFMDLFLHKTDPEQRFTKGVPDWPFLDQFASFRLMRLLWIGVYIAIYVYFQAPWWAYALIPLHVLMGPVHGVIINWFAHKYGYTNFKLKDTSKNIMPIDLMMMGECLHNNHHKFGGRIKFSHLWYEFDPTYWIAQAFNALGIIQIKKTDGLGITA